MKKTGLIINLLWLCSFIFAQDNNVQNSRITIIGQEQFDEIVQTNGIKIKAQVIEITAKEIKYKKATNLTGPTYILSKTEVLKIIYKNGTVEFFTQQNTEEYVQQTTDSLPSSTNLLTTKQRTNLCLQGESDAEAYHKRATGNFLVGFGFGLVGLVAIAITDPVKPSVVYVSQEKRDNEVYMHCYKKQAKKKNLNSALLGAVLGTALTVIIVSN